MFMISLQGAGGEGRQGGFKAVQCGGSPAVQDLVGELVRGQVHIDGGDIELAHQDLANQAGQCGGGVGPRGSVGNAVGDDDCVGQGVLQWWG